MRVSLGRRWHLKETCQFRMRRVCAGPLAFEMEMRPQVRDNWTERLIASIAGQLVVVMSISITTPW
jgi:hypothetical protein